MVRTIRAQAAARHVTVPGHWPVLIAPGKERILCAMEGKFMTYSMRSANGLRNAGVFGPV